MSSSRYLSGYFDEKAVELYFNEFSQPANGNLSGTNTGTDNSTNNATDSGKEKVVPVDSSNNDQRSLVLILSSNSDEIANSIASFAQSDAVTQTLASIVGHSQIQEAANSQLQDAAQSQAGQALANLGSTLLALNSGKSTLNSDATTAANVLAYANALGQFLKPGTQFQSLKDVQAFLQNNPELAATTGGK